MGIAAPLVRTGLVLLQLHTMRLRGLGRASTEGLTRRRRHRTARQSAPLDPVSFWATDEGEPTWEDAEWQ